MLHIGCGAGYYTAILSELVTRSGAVVAWDVEPSLFEAARHNLDHWPNVSIALQSGTAPPIPESDIIYVCAGCTQPMRAWVEALSDGGRLLFPLTPGWDFGGMLMITRQGDRYGARFVSRCSFIPCIGGSALEQQKPLREAFAAGNMDSVSSLQLGDGKGQSGAWFVGDDWWLSVSQVRQ